VAPTGKGTGEQGHWKYIFICLPPTPASRAHETDPWEVPRLKKRGQARWWLSKEHHLVKSHFLQKLCPLQVSNQTMTKPSPAQPASSEVILSNVAW